MIPTPKLSRFQSGQIQQEMYMRRRGCNSMIGNTSRLTNNNTGLTANSFVNYQPSMINEPQSNMSLILTFLSGIFFVLSFMHYYALIPFICIVIYLIFTKRNEINYTASLKQQGNTMHDLRTFVNYTAADHKQTNNNQQYNMSNTSRLSLFNQTPNSKNSNMPQFTPPQNNNNSFLNRLSSRFSPILKSTTITPQYQSIPISHLIDGDKIIKITTLFQSSILLPKIIQPLIYAIDQSDQDLNLHLKPIGIRLNTESKKTTDNSLSVYDRFLPPHLSSNVELVALWKARSVLESYLQHPSYPEQRNFVLMRLREIAQTKNFSLVAESHGSLPDYLIVENLLFRLLDAHSDFCLSFVRNYYSPTDTSAYLIKPSTDYNVYPYIDVQIGKSVYSSATDSTTFQHQNMASMTSSVLISFIVLFLHISETNQSTDNSIPQVIHSFVKTRIRPLLTDAVLSQIRGY